MRALKADVFLGNQDMFFGLHEKRARQTAGNANAFVDPGALQAFDTDLEAAFETELARQQSKMR